MNEILTAEEMQEKVKELVASYGSNRAAAEALKIKETSLSEMQNGHMPVGKALLELLGYRSKKTIVYTYVKITMKPKKSKLDFTEIDSNVCQCSDWEDWHDAKGCLLRTRCKSAPCKKYVFSRVAKRRQYMFKKKTFLAENSDFESCVHNNRMLIDFNEGTLEAKYLCKGCRSIVIRKPSIVCQNADGEELS